MKILIVLLMALTASCTQFSGDHPVEKLRQMWYSCMFSIKNTAPWIPPPAAIVHCDCMIDSAREKFKSSDYEEMKNLEQEFSQISKKCFDVNSSGSRDTHYPP